MHESTSADLPNAEKLRILIVDDEPMLRSVIEEFLGLIGYAPPVLAGDGREALEQLRSGTFDCVISDIRMPEMPLEELLGVIGEEFPRLIVIATSGYNDLENAMHIIERGAHDFLGKPLNLDSLEMALNWVVQRAPLLEAAGRLFGSGADGGASRAERLDQLGEMLAANHAVFAEPLHHSRRVARAVRCVAPMFPEDDWVDLELAALLHELGSSHLMQSLVEQPRQLDPQELDLVRSHAHVSGRLAARHLNRPEFKRLIGDHHQWGQKKAEDYEAADRESRLAIWLGMLNYVDGCLRERPARMPYRPDQVQESLRRRHQATQLQPIRDLLQVWDLIVPLYQ